MVLFARDGHLLDVALDRAALGDLSAEEEEHFEEHFYGCEACRIRSDAAGKILSAPLPPLAAMLLPTPLLDLPAAGGQAANVAPVKKQVAEKKRSWKRWAPFALLPLAAGLLLWTLPAEAPPEAFRAKGTGLELEVHRSTAEGSERLADGAVVRQGDRLGFRVRSDKDGYLLILGVDARGSDYPCYPQGVAPPAAMIAASELPQQLSAAVALDATPGGETIYAVRCDRAFNYRDMAGLLVSRPDVPALPGGCVYQKMGFPRDGQQAVPGERD